MSDTITSDTHASEEAVSDDSSMPADDELPTATAVQIATLRAENKQLRAEYARARQANYRRTALGLFLVGAVALAGGVVFPAVRTVLFALGGTGVFAGVLTSLITPERFITASVGTQLFEVLSRDREAIVDELGLQGDPVYLPGEECRLFIPQQTTATLPTTGATSSVFVIPEGSTEEGVTFYPTGEELYAEFTDVADLPADPTPQGVVPSLADALVELFELADGVDYDVDESAGRVTLEVAEPGLGDPTALDHPIASMLAVALAHAVERPIRVTVTDDEPLLITCRYESAA